MKHVDDKYRFCKGCKKNILIKFNQIGGFWYLNGWVNKYGIKYFGDYCSECFYKLHDIKDKESLK